MPRRSWKELWTRVSAMRADEVRTRALQEFDKYIDWLRYRAGLGFQQEPEGSSQPGRFFFESPEVPALLDMLRQRLPQRAEAIVQRAELMCAHRFCLLGYADLTYGPAIDWHFDPVHQKRSPRKPWFQINYLDPGEVGDPKIIWELNRHQHLVVLAKAFRLTSDDHFAKELFQQWYSWQAENPYPLGLNWASGLEVGLRSLSWLWVYFLLEGCPVVPKAFPADLLRALSLSGRHIERYLSTYSSPNTHLLGEAVALFFVGTLCPQLPSSGRWQQAAWRILLDQARKQVRPDGFHFEQSTYYHVYALDFFLHARLLAGRNNIAIPPWFDQILQRMLQALFLLSQTGTPPRLGDDDGGRVFDSSRNLREHLLDPLATGAVLFDRSDWKSASGALREETLWLLGPTATHRFDSIPSSSPNQGSAVLTSSGLYVMTDSNHATWQMVIDGGPQGAHGAGHGHADALSVHLSANGRELLCDPGTFEYGGDGQGRRWFRSTPAHNTLQVDGLDQAQVQGPFAWTSLPTTNVQRWITAQRFDIFRGSHTGYRRLTPPVTHERWVLNFKAAGWLVRDVASGEGEHDLDLAWHFGPRVGRRSGGFFTDDGTIGLGLRGADGQGWSEQLSDEWWSPAYGVKMPAKTLHYRFRGRLPAELATLLVPLEAESEEDGSFLSFNGTSEVRGYGYSSNKGLHCAIFGLCVPWSLEGWVSDADLLCYHFNEDGLQSLLLCNGTFLECQGRRLISGKRSVTWCELVRNQTSLEITSPVADTITVERDLDLFCSKPAPITAAPGTQKNGMEH